jgi:PleD family two-component response regulator
MPQDTTPLRGHFREHILCVDDEEGILAALRQQLSARFGSECDIAVAKNAREALDLMEDLQQDGEHLAVVIADQIMPGMKGVELLEEVHRRSPHTVKILLTGQAGLDAVVYAINKAGLDQYIPKPWDEPDLRLTIQNFLSRFRLERERAELLRELQTKNAELATLNSSLEEKVVARTKELENLNVRLAELAITDGLTDLYNHRHFRERLSLEMERSNRTGLPLSVLMIDVDHFKGYNDRHGHLAGDNALRGVSKILQHGRRSGKLTISLGVASFPDDGAEPSLVLAAADRALFAAKNAGRNRVRVAGT